MATFEGASGSTFIGFTVSLIAGSFRSSIESIPLTSNFTGYNGQARGANPLAFVNFIKRSKSSKFNKGAN